MGQNTRVERLVDIVVTEDFPAAHDVRLRHEFGVEHEVDRERILQLRT